MMLIYNKMPVTDLFRKIGMVKVLLIITLIGSHAFRANCQNIQLSGDGKFIGGIFDGNLHVQETNGPWQKSARANEFKFLWKGRWLAYKFKDTLRLVNMENKSERIYTDVTSFIATDKDTGPHWLALKTNGNLTVFCNPLDRQEVKFLGNIKSIFTPDGNRALLYLTGDSSQRVLKVLNLSTGLLQQVWKQSADQKITNPLDDIVFDHQNKQMAFSTINVTGPELWYYRFGDVQAKRLLNDTADRVFQQMQLDTIPLIGFDRSDRNLLFMMSYRPPKIVPAKSGALDFDLWSASDPVLMSYQKKFLDATRNCVMSLNIGSGKINQLEDRNQLMANTYTGIRSPAVFLHHKELISKSGYFITYTWNNDLLFNNLKHEAIEYLLSDYYWSKADRVSISLKNIFDGSTIPIKKDMRRCTALWPLADFSPDGQYVVYFDEDSQSYHCFNLQTKVDENISRKIPVNLLLGYDLAAGRREKQSPKGVVGWRGEHILLLQDHYSDIWQVNLENGKCLNLTAGLCRKYHLELSVKGAGYSFDEYNASNVTFAIRDELTSGEGLIKIDFNRLSSPEMIKGHFHMTFQESSDGRQLLVKKESLQNPPRLFAGQSLKKLQPLTSLNPFMPYKRQVLNIRLMKWRSFDGSMGFGLMYLPKNFDKRRKYPVIISYYEGDDKLNKYQPDIYAREDDHVSVTDPKNNETYITFVPSIEFRNSKQNGLEAAYNYVVSGAMHLASLPYVNQKAIGIKGSSWGGAITNYIIAHTNFFAAAIVSAGATDWMSWFGTVDNDPDGFPRNDMGGQARMGKHTMAQAMQLVKNSPVFYASKIKTPVLMIANPEDQRVPWSQGVEFFKLLRRFGKRAWLISYKGYGHYPPRAHASKFEAQFYDYFLRNKPVPIWMSRGIPAVLKNQIDPFAYDPDTKKLGPSLLDSNLVYKN